MGAVRVNRGLLRQKVAGDLVGRDPNMIATSEIYLVNGTVFFRPLIKFDVTVLFGNIWH